MFVGRFDEVPLEKILNTNKRSRWARRELSARERRGTPAQPTLQKRLDLLHRLAPPPLRLEKQRPRPGQEAPQSDLELLLFIPPEGAVSELYHWSY
ncbi:hypothetical protein AOLI_G00104720 [Acnodon oligacanthus]